MFCRSCAPQATFMVKITYSADDDGLFWLFVLKVIN